MGAYKAFHEPIEGDNSVQLYAAGSVQKIYKNWERTENFVRSHQRTESFVRSHERTKVFFPLLGYIEGVSRI
jgi:hypothetical protein